MKNVKIILMLGLILVAGSTLAQETDLIHHYEFGIYTHQDLRNASMNAVSTQRLLNDLYRANLAPKLDGKIGAVTTEVFSFFNVYLSMLWSHEFGHSLRAKQVGGGIQDPQRSPSNTLYDHAFTGFHQSG